MYFVSCAVRRWLTVCKQKYYIVKSKMHSLINILTRRWYSRVVLRNLTADQLLAYRNLEQCSKKLVTQFTHLEFNETCYKEYLLLIYSNITQNDATARKL